jgi:hypothetical protein
MDTKVKVLEIIDIFGIKDKKAAEFMGISYSQFTNKKHQRNYNKFHPSELYSLISYLREKVLDLP